MAAATTARDRRSDRWNKRSDESAEGKREEEESGRARGEARTRVGGRSVRRLIRRPRWLQASVSYARRPTGSAGRLIEICQMYLKSLTRGSRKDLKSVAGYSEGVILRPLKVGIQSG